MDTNLLDWRCFCRVCATWLLQWAFPGVKFSQMWLWSLLHKWFKRGEAGDYLLSNWKENQCLLSNLSCEREAQVVLEPQLQHYCCGMENGVWNHPPLGYPSNSGTSQIGNSYQEHESLVCIQVIKGMMSWRLTYSANTALVLAVLVFGLALLFDLYGTVEALWKELCRNRKTNLAWWDNNVTCIPAWKTGANDSKQKKMFIPF